MNRIISTLFVMLIFLASCTSNKTCEICGYIAIESEKCAYCGNQNWTESTGVSKEDYLKSKQKDWFYIPGGEPNFYEPNEVENRISGKKFTKDASWKPTISKEEMQ